MKPWPTPKTHEPGPELLGEHCGESIGGYLSMLETGAVGSGVAGVTTGGRALAVA